MIAWLLLLAAQPASMPASAPALAPGGTGADVSATVTFIFELDEGRLKAQESWNFDNRSGKRIGTEHLVFTLPAGAQRLGVDEDAAGWKGAEDSTRFFAINPLGAGASSVGAAYFLPFSGSSLRTTRTIPVQTVGMRVIIEDVDGLKVSANLKHQHRVSELNGLHFAIYDFEPLKANQTLELTFSGLPSRSTIPRGAAVLACVLIFVWMLISIRSSKSEVGTAGIGPLSAQARKEQIVKALELLERQFASQEVKERRYLRRHEELTRELAEVLRELELPREAR